MSEKIPPIRPNVVGSTVNDDEEGLLETLSQDLRNILIPSSRETSSSSSAVKTTQSNTESILLKQQKGMLNDSESSDEEHFRCTNATPISEPEPESERIEVEVKNIVAQQEINHPLIPDDEKLLEQQKELLSESYSSDEEDFRCVDATPPESEKEYEELDVPSMTSLVGEENLKISIVNSQAFEMTTTLLDHQNELLQSDTSSADEDFRCEVHTPTPPLSPNNENVHPIPSFNYGDHWEIGGINNIEGNKDNEVISSNHQSLADDEASSCKSEHKDRINAGSIHFIHSVQEDTETVHDEEKQLTDMNVKEIADFINKTLPTSIKAKIGLSINQNAVSSSASKRSNEMVYDRQELIDIKDSRTNEEWMAYMWVNHGRNWLIQEVPFQLDSELRCPYNQQLRVRRMREASERRDALAGRKHMSNTINHEKFIQNSGKHSVGNIADNTETGKNTNGSSKSKKKNKKKSNQVDGSFGAVQRRVIGPQSSLISAAANSDSFTTIESAIKNLDPKYSFVDCQIDVWLKYLSCINLRIKQLVDGIPATETLKQ